MGKLKQVIIVLALIMWMLTQGLTSNTETESTDTLKENITKADITDDINIADENDIISIEEIHKGIIRLQYKGDNFCVVYVKNNSKLDSKEYKYIIYDKDSYIFSLTDGDGTYSIKAYSVIQDSNGNELIDNTSNEYNITLENSDENIYKYSTSLVNYESTETKNLINSVFKNTNSIDEIFFYFSKIRYDDDLADSISSGVVKTHSVNFSKVIESKKGICLDIATSMAIVLRYKGYPTQLVYGYVTLGNNTAYHSWIRVYIDGNWRSYDPTFGKTSDEINNNTYRITEYH